MHEAKFLLISAILTGMVAALLALYLKWTAKAFAGYHCDYFVCYGVAIVACLVNLFGPYIYAVFMEPYRKLPAGVEFIFLNGTGIFFCIWLYRFWLRGPKRQMLSWQQATLIAGAQYVFFVILSYGLTTSN